MERKRKTRRKMRKRRNRKSNDEERSLINVAPFEKLSVFLAHFSVWIAGRDSKSGKALKNMVADDRHERKQSRDARETVAAGYFVPGTNAV